MTPRVVIRVIPAREQSRTVRAWFPPGHERHAPPVLPPPGRTRLLRSDSTISERAAAYEPHSERREAHTGSGMARTLLPLPPPHLARVLVAVLLLTRGRTVRANKGATPADDDRDKEGDAEAPCELKTVTVSTLPVLRENEFSFTGAAPGSVVGGGGGGGGGGAGGLGGGVGGGVAAGAGVGGGGGPGGGGGSGGGGESRLLLFVRTDLPGQISVMDDLDNTALPYFTLGKRRFATLSVPHAGQEAVSPSYPGPFVHAKLK